VIGEVNHTYFSDLTSCLCRSNFVVKAHLCNECHLGHGLYAQECMMMRRFVISKVHPDMQSMDKSDCPTKVQVQSLKRDSENFSSGDVSQCCLFICTSVCVICHGTCIDSIYCPPEAHRGPGGMAFFHPGMFRVICQPPLRGLSNIRCHLQIPHDSSSSFAPSGSSRILPTHPCTPSSRSTPGTSRTRRTCCASCSPRTPSSPSTPYIHRNRSTCCAPCTPGTPSSRGTFNTPSDVDLHHLI
jgi:hypothetical protein